TGYDEMSVDQFQSQVHLLSLRDITSEWEAQRLQQEMAMARHMQTSILPSRLPATAVFDVAARCLPASQVGGDIYDARLLADGSLAILLGDAAGHGTDSALLAAVAAGAFRTALEYDPTPAMVLAAIDRALMAVDHRGFVSVAYLLFAARGDRMSYGLAGHPPLFLAGPHTTTPADPPLPSSIPLGVKLPSSYYLENVALRGETVIAVCSDGLLDLPVGDGLFASHLPYILDPHIPAESLVKRILDAAGGYRGESGEQDDDITIVVVRVQSQAR
ncbi:SpoIIE family protein phosphatase, partial [bacterium]|nr:SpoIIE family protein phosphatase [candidate division CSSED10-310 bacterium]